MSSSVVQAAFDKPRRRIPRWTIGAAWIMNVGLLIAAFAWTYFDGRSSHMVDILQEKIGRGAQGFDLMVPSAQSNARLVTALIVTATVACCTLLTMFVSLFFGPEQFRSMRAWLWFTLLVGGWLGFVVAGPEIYWRGQQRRVAHVLAPVESMAQRLNASWPLDDGDHPDVGPFLAYPKGAPTLVMPLKWITFPKTSLRFSAVERSSDGVVRFELAGSEAGAWLEWRADDRPPRIFKNGLEMYYNVSRYQRLAPHWYLVRYRQVFFGGGGFLLIALCPTSRFC
jgi:hypothetical protein